MSKKDVPAIVSAMGVLMSLLDGLVKAVKAVGGTMEDLYRLATPEGQGLLAEIGQLIARVGKIIFIDRTQPFDPVQFLGKDWSIEEQDECSLALTQLNFAKVHLVNMLREGETGINGEEWLERLKEAGHIRLDAKIFQTFRENQVFIPEHWKGKPVYFFGTVLRDPGGYRCVLYLCRRGDGQWALENVRTAIINSLATI